MRHRSGGGERLINRTLGTSPPFEFSRSGRLTSVMSVVNLDNSLPSFVAPSLAHSPLSPPSLPRAFSFARCRAPGTRFTPLSRPLTISTDRIAIAVSIALLSAFPRRRLVQRIARVVIRYSLPVQTFETPALLRLTIGERRDFRRVRAHLSPRTRFPRCLSHRAG